MKVKKEFYCIQEKKAYKAGDEYTGKRKDLGALLETAKKDKKAPIAKKGAIETKKKKSIPKVDIKKTQEL